MAEEAKKGKTVIAKKDFLEMVRAALGKALEGGPNAGLRLSRERTNTFWNEVQGAILARAEEGSFSVRGFGSYYIIVGKDRGEGKSPNRYIRFKRKLPAPSQG